MSLHSCAAQGKHEMVIGFLEVKKEKIDQKETKEFKGSTPLHLASEKGHQETVKLLLDKVEC